MVDEVGVISMLVDRSRVFIGQNDHTWLVLHKTASGGTAQDIATFFAGDPAMASTHYIVGQDGTIVQCVLEVDGAGGNCCLETGHASYLPLGVNMNVKTVSIEHVDPASDNSTPLTSAQQAASFKLVHDICMRHNIPMRKGDASGGIIGHCDIAPLSRARCPGNYPWDALFAYLQNGGSMLPAGWSDDGMTLTAPNGVPFVLGFRAHVLPLLQSGAWDPNDYPLKPQYYAPRLEASNADLGDGDQIITRKHMLCYPHNPTGSVASLKNSVIEEYVGTELDYTRNQYAALYAAYQTLKAGQAQPQVLTDMQTIAAVAVKYRATP